MSQCKELVKNWERFAKLTQAPIEIDNAMIAAIFKRYAAQNIEALNDILGSSIEHLNELQKMKSLNEAICTQARLTDEMGKKLLKAAEKFFNASLDNVSDYNEWLKTHCDLATD